MTRTELTELLHRHAHEGEPTSPMPVDAVVARGRRAVRRRRLGGGVAMAAVAVAAVALVPHTIGGGSADDTIAPATQQALRNYDASQMPQLIDDHVHSAFSGSVADLGAGEFIATDEQETKLPEKYYDMANAMRMQYDEGDHRFSVYLAHARSEAEGNARRICADDIDSGLDFSCTVAHTDAGVATTTVSALLPEDHAVSGMASWSWAAVTKSQVQRRLTPKWLREDPVGGTSRSKHFDPHELWFERSVKVVHSQTFVTATSEFVRASSYEEAMQRFEVPAEVLTTVSTDPELVIPEPPKGKNGCPWLLHPEGISCNVKPAVD
ncbi:MAG TPA: hypothetical protein VF426_02395 [Marmoricola sp.]